MASGTKLVLTFEDSNGDNTQFSYSDVKASATKANVVALAQAMISSTEIYEKTLVTLKKALLRTTTEDEYDLSDTVFRERSTYIATPEEPPEEPPEETTDDNEVVTEEKIARKQ